MNRRSLSAVLIFLAACNRYEWKSDFEVPALCPKPRRDPALPVPPHSEMALEGTTVRGRVVYGDSATPVSGSLVALSAAGTREARTDAGGSFVLDSVSAGSYVLRIRAIGFNLWQDTVDVVPMPRPSFEVRLTPAPLDGPCSGFEKVRVRKPWWKFR
jgi:hypothetical protein